MFYVCASGIIKKKNKDIYSRYKNIQEYNIATCLNYDARNIINVFTCYIEIYRHKKKTPAEGTRFMF